jgi:ribulose 1,5-bisphosphate carboxylase large subunit-like protein
LRQAWDAAVAGKPLADHARNHGELASALTFW